MSAAGPAAAEKCRIAAACLELIEQDWRPRYLPTITPTSHNYPVALLGAWHGLNFRFLTRYRSGFAETRGEEYEVPFSRLEWLARDSFRLAFLRHTGRWWPLFGPVDLGGAMSLLRNEPLLGPHL